MAYQPERYGDFLQTRDPAIFQDIPAITDQCLHLQHCAVQARGKALGALVLLCQPVRKG